MTRWLVAAIPLLAAVAASWFRFTGALAEETFRGIFLAGSAAWFVLALHAQASRPRQNRD